MSLRDSMSSSSPKPRGSATHYFLTFSRGESFKCFAISPLALFSVVGLAPVVLSVYLGATMYLIYRDDMLAGLMSRQTEMQYAYEDRLAAMRSQVDRVTGRQLLDQNTLEGRVHDLLSRQAQIESRASVITTLAQQAGVGAETTVLTPKSTDARGAINRSMSPLLAAPALPAGASAYAPTQPAPAQKPRPENTEQHSTLESANSIAHDIAMNPDVPVDLRLGALSGSLQRIEVAQVRAVSAVGVAARKSALRIRTAMQDAGLPVDKMMSATNNTRGVGGPFVPLKADPNGSMFEREVYRLQNDFINADKLSRLVRKSPLRRPLSTKLDITSPFGGRVDPFFGRMATHTGIDLREATGTPAKATAAGKVVTAGWNGGYGNMVEIDHGNGLTTRYAHLSSIAVEEGQTVDSREVIGRVGSTGRSTGAHLHYEVRVDDTPVDPMRFLRAGERLAVGD